MVFYVMYVYVHCASCSWVLLSWCQHGGAGLALFTLFFFFFLKPHDKQHHRVCIRWLNSYNTKLSPTGRASSSCRTLPAEYKQVRHDKRGGTASIGDGTVICPHAIALPISSNFQEASAHVQIRRWIFSKRWNTIVFFYSRPTAVRGLAPA